MGHVRSGNGPRARGRDPRDGERTGSLLVARGVSRTVGGLRILAPVSLEARPGACVVLRGPNGSGKTTLLRLLLGLDRPTSGAVRIADPSLTRRDIAGVLGMPPFFENLTVLEHLLFVRASWGLPPGSVEPLALLRAFDAERLARHFPDELSSGERQIVALSLGLARPARILVLDEPEQRLDQERRAALAGLLRTRLAAGTAVVMATHAPDLADAVADRVITLDPA
jgi:ABC-type multidrug transport system ATPase subunit